MKEETKMRGLVLVIAILAIAVAAIGLKAFAAPASGAVAVATQQQKTSTLDEIERTGVLRACYAELPPTVMKDPKTGELSGVLVDMAKELASGMNAKLEFQQTTWGTFPADLNSHRCDLSVAATFITIPRAKTIAYSRPIAVTGNSAVVRKGSELEKTASIDDFDKKGIVVAVLNGEQGHEYVKQHFKNAEIRVVQGSDDTLPLLEVLTGRADVGLHESVVVARFAAAHPEVVDVFAERPYNPVQIAWAMRSDDAAFTNFISTSLGVMETSGKIAEIESRYDDTYWLTPKVELVKS